MTGFATDSNLVQLKANFVWTMLLQFIQLYDINDYLAIDNGGYLCINSRHSLNGV